MSIIFGMNWLSNISRRTFLTASLWLVVGCSKTKTEDEIFKTRENIRIHIINKAFDDACIKTLDAEKQSLERIKNEKSFWEQAIRDLIEDVGNKVYWRIRNKMEWKQKLRDNTPFGSLYPENCFRDDSIELIMTKSDTLTKEQRRSLLDRWALKK